MLRSILDGCNSYLPDLVDYPRTDLWTVDLDYYCRSSGRFEPLGTGSLGIAVALRSLEQAPGHLGSLLGSSYLN